MLKENVSWQSLFAQFAEKPHKSCFALTYSVDAIKAFKVETSTFKIEFQKNLAKYSESNLPYQNAVMQEYVGSQEKFKVL